MYKLFTALSILVMILFPDAGDTLIDEEYTITPEIIPPYTGYIEIEPHKKVYAKGEVVNITAIPGGRFHFKEWGGAIDADAGNPLEGFVIDGNVTVSAIFEAGYLSDRPLLSPRRNVVYMDKPRDLYFQVHQNRHPLLSIEKDGRPVTYTRQKLENPHEAEGLPDSETIKIPEDYVAHLTPGRHRINFLFDNGIVLDVEIKVIAEGAIPDHGLTIISFYVDHGDAVFIELPDGETMMLDTGTRAAAETYVIPFLKSYLPKDEQGRQRIDNIFISHWHYDHFSGLGALLEEFGVGQVRYNLAYPPNEFGDYDDFQNPNDPYGYGEFGFPPQHWEEFRVGNTITGIGGKDVEIKILNAPLFDEHDDKYKYYRSEYFEEYDNRNNRSLSLNLRYKDFIFSMGGDIYQHAQRAILNTFENDVRAHIYHANHHFHGGVLKEYLLAVEPYIFITSANAAVYDRDAYARVVLNEVIPKLEEESTRFIESLLSYEVGITIVRIDGDKDWSDDTTELFYETY
jgi:hypothetical protein